MNNDLTAMCFMSVDSSRQPLQTNGKFFSDIWNSFSPKMTEKRNQKDSEVSIF